jgi:hypothetical protein
VIYVAIANFKEMQYPEWIFVLALESSFVCLAFAPAFMLLKGFKTRPWHWVVIGAVEAIIIAVALYALFVLIALAITPVDS